MKLFILLSRVPYPLEKGDKLRAFHQIKYLSRDHEIILCCLEDGVTHPDAEGALRKYCSEVHIIRLRKISIWINLLRGLFSPRPFQVSYFYHRQAQRKIDRIIERHLPGHILCQLVRVSEYVRKYKIIPSTLDYMDALSKGVERRISYSGFLMRWFLRSEAKRLAAYEREIFGCFHNKTIITEQDRALINHPDNSSIWIVPNGVELDHFRPRDTKKEYEIVFTGNMNYPPNVDCALFLANRIMPLVWRRMPSARLLISGANPSAAVRTLGSEKVKITGWLDDIRDSYAKSKVFAAPMQMGSGLQNKLLEAMSMKIPCVTSALANNALSAIPEHHVLIGSSPEEYASLIIRLLTDENLYEVISGNAYDFVTANYRWDASGEALNGIIQGTQVKKGTKIWG